MGLGEKNGEELDQVKVAPIPVFETNVPDKFVLGGHVVVSDHAAIPTGTELHSDVTSDEVMGEGEGGITGDPSPPMGQRGLRWWGRGRREHRALLPVGKGVGRIYDRGCQAPFVPPPTYDKR